ncbi:polymorphic toxin-type HINT domain-containing protein [Streptomyces purpureus]|uniref:Hint domain-containing protein n=1 Tax=Streptomyces purpureus TaxID=1951 RepID=A0A918HJW0_9ACTN|nr:polymorphic toxin-type HINT domain-containing protein [Streptomyces purpureus]GGT66776.1 hypothetical protein GCM10014713_69270 [Streptomyces purpureus]
MGGADYNDKRETKGAGHYNGSTGSGWFKDHAGGWSYRYKQNVGGFTASQTIWSDRASSRGYKKHASVNVVKNPPPPKNFYQKYIGPVLGSVILPDPQAWQDCFGDGSIQQCAWAATDLPFLKPFKALKAVKKLDESAETTSDATRKPGCPEHSFLPGTKVLLTDGTTKSIEDIREGDKVLATDPDTGETRGQDVVQTIITKDDKEFTELTIKAGNGNASIVATDTHPFWSTDQNKWIDAGDVTPGTTLRTTDERGVQVLAVRHYKKQQRTHDLTIDRIHTYYVLAGATPVLVHNSNCGDVILGSGEGTADALRAFTSTKPETEFVFDSGAGRFLAGDRERIPGGLSPHEQLAEKAGMDRGTVLGGTLFRDNGRLVFTENSGHYGHRWTDATRQQFQKFMSDQGIDFDYRPWG